MRPTLSPSVMPEVTSLPPALLRRLLAHARALVAAMRIRTLNPVGHPAGGASVDRLAITLRDTVVQHSEVNIQSSSVPEHA